MRYLTRLLAAAALILPGSASALTINLDTVFNGDGPASTAPYLIAEFTTVAPGEVTLTLTSSLDVASEYIHEVAFNIDAGILPSSITVAQGSGPTAVVMNGAQDAQVIQGTGASGFGFDFALEFPIVPPAARFNDSLVAVFTLTGGAITESDFDFTNSGDGIIVGAHLHGIACTETSLSADCFPGGIFDPNGTTSGAVKQVPEPGTAVLMVTGLLGLAWNGRSRRS